MKERQILFSAPMVRAILDGSKTQTRRVVKNLHTDCNESFIRKDDGLFGWRDQSGRFMQAFPCPYGQPGDRLWVRETWKYTDWTGCGEPFIEFSADNDVTRPKVSEDWSDRIVDIWEILSRDENFNIDNCARDRKWRPSIHMPRWASRLLLEIVSVRVERLQDISEADSITEGIKRSQRAISSTDVAPCFWDYLRNEPQYRNARDSYASLWESINGPGSWSANPWVWCIEFRRVNQ